MYKRQSILSDLAASSGNQFFWLSMIRLGAFALALVEDVYKRQAYFSPYAFIIRKDWLDRLGLEAPTTIDEWVTVLEAFRDEDANGDGNPNNEIPFTVGGHAWYTTYWANGWGLHLFQSDGWYPDENGQMQHEFIRCV